MVRESLNETLDKLKKVIKNFEKSYCRFEIYFEVDNLQKLDQMKEQITEKIQNIEVVSINHQIIIGYLEKYILNLKNLISKENNIENLLCFMVIYWNLLKIINPETVITK